MAVREVGDVLMRCMELWKNTGRGWEFSSHTRFEVDDGCRIRFWHDVRCRDQALKAAFSKRLTTGRWISLPYSLVCCALVD